MYCLWICFDKCGWWLYEDNCTKAEAVAEMKRHEMDVGAIGWCVLDEQHAPFAREGEMAKKKPKQKKPTIKVKSTAL